MEGLTAGGRVGVGSGLWACQLVTSNSMDLIKMAFRARLTEWNMKRQVHHGFSAFRCFLFSKSV